MDITPFLHALCAVAAQLLIGLFTGNWAYGAIAGCTFFIARDALCCGCAATDWSFYRELGLRGDSRLYVLHCA